MGRDAGKGVEMARGTLTRPVPGVRIVATRLGGPLERRWTPRAVASWQHASGVWEQVRRAVVSRTPALERITAGAGDREAALGGQADLVAVALLGAHLSNCETCWTRWTDGYRPGDLLTAAIKRRPAGAVFRAAETETKARRRRAGTTRGRRR